MSNFILIILLAAFPPLSTDMYLPAIPTLCTIWGITLAQANLSLVAFFISFSAFLLLHGPLADRFGRRPVLIGGVSLYIAGSLSCAGADSITFLVLSRIIQGCGAAAGSAMALALTKDLYRGNEQKKILAYIGVLIPLCPMVAPSIGALILQYVSWRSIFLAQAILTLPALYGSFRLKEPMTTEHSGTGGVLAAIRRYGRLARNGTYMVYTLAFSVMGFSFFAFLGGSSDIYIRSFGMTEQIYSLYFGFNALALMLGSLLCARVLVNFESRRILYITLVGMFFSTGTLLILGKATPTNFALSMFAYSLFLGMSRPISNHLILKQVRQDTGTASSLLTFFNFLCAAIAMELISPDWSSKPMVIGVMGVVGSTIPFAAILAVQRGK
jgi:DHA1 family bicyclomycin/chloramphenicol resistance-like MFS transporter